MANGFQGPPAVDFYSQLSGLGDTLQANAVLRQKQQINAARQDAFSNFTALDPNSPDYGKQAMTIAQKLGSAGDQEGAVKFLTVAQTAADRVRQAERDKVTDSHWNASLRLAESARADDPTPDNFVADKTIPGGYRLSAAKARAAALVPPDGFVRQPDGSVAPIPGGPQDPVYQGRVATETARAKGDQPTIMGPGSSVIVPNRAAEGPVFTNKIGAGSGLSQDALDIRATQWNKGDYEGATKNVGRGAQGSATLEAIANRAAEKLIEQGHSPETAAELVSANMQKFRASGIGQSAEARTSANREANLNLILKATDAAIPAALEASEKVARTGWVPVNQIIQKGQVIASNPELRKFGMANLQLAEHWARAMNPTGVMRESDRDMALHFLSTADSKETYKEVVGQLKTQITRERDSIKGRSPAGSVPAAGSYVWTPDSGLVAR
jgi:hypothetical protein